MRHVAIEWRAANSEEGSRQTASKKKVKMRSATLEIEWHAAITYQQLHVVLDCGAHVHDGAVAVDDTALGRLQPVAHTRKESSG